MAAGSAGSIPTLNVASQKDDLGTLSDMGTLMVDTSEAAAKDGVDPGAGRLRRLRRHGLGENRLAAESR